MTDGKEVDNATYKNETIRMIQSRYDNLTYNLTTICILT
jgi:hypothetical protein